MSDILEVIRSRYEELTPDEWDIISEQDWEDIGGGYFAGTNGDIIGPGKKGMGLLLHPTSLPGSNQHEYVSLKGAWHNGKKVYVHRIIAEAFLPNQENKPLARHLNDDPHDNRLQNLAWGDSKDNNDDMWRNGHGYSVPVISTDQNGVEECFESIDSAAKANGVTKGAVVMACRGKTHVCNGKRWRYANKI